MKNNLMKLSKKEIARLASFPEQNPNPVIEVDLGSGNITYMNPASKKYFPEMLHQQYEHPLFDNVKKHILSKKDFQCEVIVDNKIFEQKVYFIPDTALIRVYSHDITQQKKIEKNLSRLASFPENNPSPIIEIDLSGVITYYNPACLLNFPDFLVLKNEHPILVPFNKYFEKLKSGEINNYSIEIKYCDKFYTQRALIFPEYQVIRIFNIDITEQKQTEKLIREKNKEIADSINYARRIQLSILPKDDTLKKCFDDYFVLYKPKDVVSGDFYWAISTTSSTTGDKLSIIAAADCTGHGVPGALMSMVGYTLLNQTIKNPTINSPAEALNFLNAELPKNLKSYEQDVAIRDGMDIALCAIDFDKNKLYFSGANNPCWIVRNIHLSGGAGLDATTDILNYQLIELKPDKQAISASTDLPKKSFTNQQFDFQKNDCIYLFTDGYADQFGGPKGKKLMAKKFKEILLNIQDKSMKEQEQYLDNFIENWKAGTEQVDDILVIGVRL